MNPLPPKLPWSTPSIHTILLHLSSPCSRKDLPTSQLPPIFPPYLTAISPPGLTVRYLAGWDRVVQRFTSNVQNVSLLPPSPSLSQLVSGLPVTVPRLPPSYMPLSGVSYTPRHVTLNPSPYFLILCLINTFCFFTIFNPEIPIQYTISQHYPYPS